MSDVDFSATIYIGNINCQVRGLPSAVFNQLSRELSIHVPNYYFSTKYKNGQWDGYLHFLNRRSMTFPTGLIDMVDRFLHSSWECEIEYADLRGQSDVSLLHLDPIDYGYQISSDKVARSYQVDAFNKLATHDIGGVPIYRGIFNLATNAGKTSLASMVICELYDQLISSNSMLLFVTHSKEIARQARESISGDLGIRVGMIGDGSWDVQTVSVALIATLNRRVNKPEFQEIIGRTAAFIADEAHHTQAATWYNTFGTLKNANVRIGLTGTVDKANPVNEMRLYAATGIVVAMVTNQQLIDSGFSAKPICMFCYCCDPELGDVSFQEAYSLGIVDSDQRLEYMHAICDLEVRHNRHVLILVDRIDHGEIIAEELSTVNGVVRFTNGQESGDTRNRLLEGLMDGSIDVLIATSILDEGVDVSGINAIIYARGGKSTRKLLQGLGRGIRAKADGSAMRFYDFIDDVEEHLLQHSMERYNILSSEGFETHLIKDVSELNDSYWEGLDHGKEE